MAGTPMQLCDRGYLIDNYRTEILGDEFFNYTSTNSYWTTVLASSGTAAADDTAGTSMLLLTTAATLADYVIVKTTKQPFLPAANHPIFMEAKLYNFTNQATNNGVWFAGFASTTTLSMTSGGPPTASYSGALIFKTGASDSNNAVISVQSSNGSTKTTTVTNYAFVTGQNAHCRIDIQDLDGANCSVTYMIGGHMLRDTNNVPIKHIVAYSSLVKQNLILGVQAGSANAQTANWDMVSAGQLRVGL